MTCINVMFDCDSTCGVCMDDGVIFYLVLSFDALFASYMSVYMYVVCSSSFTSNLQKCIYGTTRSCQYYIHTCI